ncbi:pyrrolo-quinoline quinone, partial [Halobacteriales archaeon QH_7_68_42]
FGIEDLVYRYESLRNVQEWTFDTFGRISGAPVFADGTVYVASRDGSVYAMDASNGSEEWETDLGDRVNGLSLRNGRLYAATEGNRLVQLNTQGNEVWSVSTGAGATGTPAVTEDLVYVGTRDGELIAFTVGDGFEEWRYTEPTNEVSSPAVVADGTVYFGSNDSNVYAVDAQSGGPEWSFGTGNNIVNPAPVVSGGMVFIGSRDGTFYALSD